MEKEPKKIEWPKVADKVLKHLNTSTQNGYEIVVGIAQSPSVEEDPIGIPDVFKSLTFLESKEMIDFIRQPYVSGSEVRNRRYWRLTEKGAQVAFDKGLITEIDHLRIIHQREQDPDLNERNK